MIRIAVVGDIGSGKSYIAKQFGYPIFNADVEVAKIYKKNRKCFNKLNKLLPKYITVFPVKKEALLKAIMANKNNIKKITKIIHPEVRSLVKNFIKKNKKRKIVVLDIPLLLENKINKKKDVLVYVDAKKKDINVRLKRRGNYNKKIIKKLRRLQLPLEIKKKRSDFIIKNDFKRKQCKKNVKKVLNKIIINARSYT